MWAVGFAVSPGKPRVPYCEERPCAAHSRRDHRCVVVGGEPGKTAPTHPPSAGVSFGRAAVRDASAIPCRGALGVRAERGVGTLRRYHPGRYLKYKFIKTTFIKKNFHQNPLSSKNHFHQKPLSSKNHFHQKPFSSETTPFSSETTPFSSEKMKRKGGTVNIVRVCVKATPSHKHGSCPPFGFQQAFMWSIARPAMLHMKVC